MNNQQQALKAAQQATDKAKAKENDMYDLLFEVHVQLLALEELIGANQDNITVRADGLAFLVGNINSQVWQVIQRLTT